MDFLAHYLTMISKNMVNNYKDNWDYHRFGPMPMVSLTQKIKNSVREKFYSKGYLNFQNLIDNKLTNALKLKYLYDNLESEQDKELLIKVLAYRTLGHTKIKLPLNTSEYWAELKLYENFLNREDFIDAVGFRVFKMSLKQFGNPVEFYGTLLGLLTCIRIKQYEYNRNGTCIKADKGDVVLDAGGCWGETALFFAHEVGENGKVYSFEFIPSNIEIFTKNLILNKELQPIIELINQPVWKEPGLKLFFNDEGPASKVSFDQTKNMIGESSTVSIDDFISKNRVQKVDFIKMDIEGAEVSALIGATQTIKKFKPKLAISLYHSYQDFDTIPKMIKEMSSEYKFYFSHCTIHAEESVLFAVINQ
jgi:FkbM family methyltransferase